MTARFLDLHNAEAAPLTGLPEIDVAALRAAILEATGQGDRLAALCCLPLQDDRERRLIAVIARGGEGLLSLLSARVGADYPALTPDCPQAHLFEREIHEQCGVIPEGHPWLKPVRLRAGGEADGEFFRVEGAEIHEVAVGPVHAGVIEPGHFRFQCHGERVLHLEIALGYQHRGIERALAGGPDRRTLHYMETLAGDTTIGHALAHAQIREALSGTRPPARAEALRGIALELERLANHTGDLGALAGDVGFLPTASYCGRVRGDFLNATALLCGSRLGRGMIRPGGVGFELDADLATGLEHRLDAASRDVADAVDLLLSTPSVAARFEETGVVTPRTCRDLGLVGVAARASGVEMDVRRDFPAGIFQFYQVPVSTWHTGDVFARAQVRWAEIQRSLAYVREQLRALPDGVPGAAAQCPPAPDRIAISLVEGWRGEICHLALTDGDGRFLGYKVIDPSFHNWMGLAMALRDEAISDFPLCNKSFNLSYCGHDL